MRVYLEIEVRRVLCRRCGAVKRERLDFLADNPFYTKRFAFYVGQRCRASTIKDVAEELQLDWETVKELDKQYMREQSRRVGTPGPQIIGIHEIAIRKRHTYRILVSDLLRERAIWFGGKDRSEASLDEFYPFLGKKDAKRIRLAIMDMWKALRNATVQHAPQAAILFGKFHIMRHLGEALDKVRKSEYARLAGRDRRYIKGQKYTLLSHRENLTLDGMRARKTLRPTSGSIPPTCSRRALGSCGITAAKPGRASSACESQVAAAQALRECASRHTIPLASVVIMGWPTSASSLGCTAIAGTPAEGRLDDWPEASASLRSNRLASKCIRSRTSPI
jgi:hypothetical protein